MATFFFNFLKILEKFLENYLIYIKQSTKQKEKFKNPWKKKELYSKTFITHNMIIYQCKKYKNFLLSTQPVSLNVAQNENITLKITKFGVDI